jgi:hypothetical protein
MPIATLTFNLPEEQSQLDLAMVAPDLAESLLQITNVLRAHSKGSIKDSDLAQRVREEINFTALDRAGY